MTKTELYEALNYIDATREKRTVMANWVLDNPKSMRSLLEIIFMGEDPISNRAGWVLDYVIQRKLSYLYIHLDFFTSKISGVQMDSSIRPLAKACQLLTIAYYSKKDKEARKALTTEHLQQIAAVAFDWLIGDYKVAAKAYSMTSLLLLGQQFKWIHPELRLVLEQNYASGSAGYKARARATLETLGKMIQN
ncbi:MAG: adenylosuccinate lyase [Bacteroidota bacterium]